MSDEPVYYLSAEQWRRLTSAASTNSSLLRDGAEVETVDLPDLPAGPKALTFYATRANAPERWPYAFLERDDHGHARTYIGDAQREENGRIVLQVWLKEAVEQLLADYHGGATDLDEAALDTRVGEVAAGREEDKKWLIGEFTALLSTCEIAPASGPAS
ncbi:MAG TPA: hypothetical protein VFW40_08120 [Capsulimonadaceae bacterium]|nr:hypothetical protein [Capsulimonadaceae bacterium]